MSLAVVKGDDDALDELSIEELARRINEENGRIRRASAEFREHVLKTGQYLLEVKRRYDNAPGFEKWCKENIEVSRGCVYRYMRLAHYDAILPPDLSLTDSATFLKSLPAIDSARNAQKYPVELRQAAIRLKSEGLSRQEVADRLDLPCVTVKNLLLRSRDPSVHSAQRRKRRERDKEATRALEKERRVRIVKSKGGNAARAFSFLRQCADACDRASEEAKSSEERAAFRAAYAHLTKAEMFITKGSAIGRQE